MRFRRATFEHLGAMNRRIRFIRRVIRSEEGRRQGETEETERNSSFRYNANDLARMKRYERASG